MFVSLVITPHQGRPRPGQRVALSIYLSIYLPTHPGIIATLRGEAFTRWHAGGMAAGPKCPPARSLALGHLTRRPGEGWGWGGGGVFYLRTAHYLLLPTDSYSLVTAYYCPIVSISIAWQQQTGVGVQEI